MHDGCVAPWQDNRADTDPVALLNKAIRLDGEGVHDIAQAAMRQVVTLIPGWDEPWLRLGQSLRARNCHDAAMAAYDAALECNPRRVEALLARGVLALQHEPPQTGLHFLTRATDLAQDNHQAWHALGHAYAAAKLDIRAAGAFRHAATLAPDRLIYAFDAVDSETWLDGPISDPAPPWSDGIRLALAGRSALQRGALDEAEAALEAAYALMPDEPWIPTALGSVHMMAMRPYRAEPALRAAHRLAPNDPVIAHDLAVALARLYRYAEAETILGIVATQGSAHPRIFCTRANQRASMGDIQGAMDDLATARMNGADEIEALRAECSLMPYRRDASAIMVRHAMETLGAMLPRAGTPMMRPQSAISDDPERPLRIGLLSNTLRTHPVGWLTLAGFEALDRDSFPIHCFGRFAPEDRLARRFAARADAWHAIDALDDYAVAALIAEQNIDILIDLGGYGDAGRMSVTAYRAAPVQIKWVGMQCTTSGIREIDWFLTDRWETPDGFERFYTERLLRLTDGYVCYLPPDNPPGFTPPPALARSHVTFGCFNNVTKITDETLTAWADLLFHVPDARLALRCPQFSESVTVMRLQERARNAGINVARLDFLGRASHREFLAGYNKIDIALDPFPYSGGLTTCESLFMGVPVVTLAGEHFAARHSVSHLSNVGLLDCVTTSTDAYIDRAMELAKDLHALTELRAGLRRQVVASPLCDAARFGKSLGAGLRHAWHDYCAAARA